MKCQWFLVLCSSIILVSNAYESKDLRCLVCRSTMNEIQKVVLKENHSKTVDVGGYQMDPSGNVSKKKKLLVQSEMYLTEVMENVCKTMENFVRATRKDNGKLVLISLSDLTSTSKLSDVDLIQDSDLNRSLEYLCKGIVEEFDDDVLAVFGKTLKNPADEVCIEATGLCNGDEEDDVADKDEL